MPNVVAGCPVGVKSGLDRGDCERPLCAQADPVRFVTRLIAQRFGLGRERNPLSFVQRYDVHGSQNRFAQPADEK
jgi:hypothetical protein